MMYPQKIETVHIEKLDNELCIYDWQRMEVHALNPTAALVWELCDGQTSPAQMAEKLLAELNAPHAGVVGWQGRAIVIPGRSMTGKTTLVKALVEAGATYYSDEFAVLDKEGRVHPYPLPLSIRGDNGHSACKIPVETLGGQIGVEPLPVGLVIVTEYQPEATWRPRKLTPGQALLSLMDNTVAARCNPAHSMPILKQAVTSVVALKSKRSEATEVASALLSQFNQSC